MFKLIKFSAIFLLLLAYMATPLAPSYAQSRQFIRDAEIENTIRAFGAPLFEAAGLNPSDIRIILIKDDELNAFVAGGMNLFLNTGLLVESANPSQLIGVIAHETGHIAGGHLHRMSTRLRGASNVALVTTILGAAAAILTGSPEAGMAILATGAQINTQNLLRFSRAQESAADQAGLNLLENTGQSARGMVEFLSILEGEELLTTNRQSPYVRTHPITRDRINNVRSFLAKSRYANTPSSPEFVRNHRRMRGKLRGFLMPPANALRAYEDDKSSVESRYARSIAYYRIPELGKSLALIDGLIAEFPEDPYFHELKGQILFENERGAEALGSYAKSVELLPNSALLRYEYAHALIERNDPSLVSQALVQARHATRLDREFVSGWKTLSIAYGRLGDFGNSALAMAEMAMLRGRRGEARRLATRATKKLKPHSAAWLRAEDIKQATAKKK